MSIDDYFIKKCYEGEIYKTVNLRNLAINQYCKDSVAVKKEQQNIEKQLTDFRNNLWNAQQPAKPEESAAADSVATDDKKAIERKTKKESSKKEETKKKKTSKPSTGGAKHSVRRTRR